MNPSIEVALKSIVGAYSVILPEFCFRLAHVRAAEKAGEETDQLREDERGGCTNP
jgi:hypothetical protein